MSWPAWNYVDKLVGLELKESHLPTSATRELRLKVYATVPGASCAF